MLLYRFITRHDWTIQLELYVGLMPHHNHLRGGDEHMLTIAPVLLDHHRRQHLNPPHTVRASTREKRQALQAGRGPAAKIPRSAPSNITRTIHQQINDNSFTVAGAPNLGSSSASSAHLFGVQHPGSHTPTLGYGLPPSNQYTVVGSLGTHPPWAQYYQQATSAFSSSSG